MRFLKIDRAEIVAVRRRGGTLRRAVESLGAHLRSSIDAASCSGGAAGGLHMAEALERRVLLAAHPAAMRAEGALLAGAAGADQRAAAAVTARVVEAGAGGKTTPHVAQGPFTSVPPTGPDHEEEGQEDGPSPTVDPVTITGDAPATAGASAPQGASDAQPQAASDFDFFRNSAVNISGSKSDVGEPSVGTDGQVVFQTGNWYASVSGDYGATFRYVSPYSTFNATDSGFTGGFCCDQRVAQVPSMDMVLWYLQYVKSGSTASDSGGVRIAAGRSKGNVLNNLWTYYNFTPASFGLPATGYWLDFPNMEVSSNYVYASTNVYSTTTDSYSQSVLWRIPLNQLKAGGSINYTYWTNVGGGFALALTQGATSTMYAGSIPGSNSLQLFTQSESNTSLSWVTISGLNTTYFGTHTAIGPDGNNWTGRADQRIQSAWTIPGQVGFMWDSAQSGDATRPQPFVRGLQINPSTNAVIGQPDIWNGAEAWHYPRVAVDARGHLSGVVWNGSASAAPRVEILVADDFASVPPPWTNFYAVGGTNGGNARWGDYAGAQPDARFPNTWVGCAYVKNGTTVTPYFFWWGRDRDNPQLLPAYSDIPDTLSTAYNTGITNAGAFATTDVIWTAANGLKDVDMYKVTASSGGLLSATTSLPSGGVTAADTILRLFDASGTQLAYSDDISYPSDTYSSLTFLLPGAGTYYLGVSAYGNDAYNPAILASGNAADDGGEYRIDVSLKAAVVARPLFYNNSIWDGGNPAVNASDDGAVAPGKFALLPGQTSSAANISGYAKGINGVMLDVGALANAGSLTAADFTVRAGTAGDPYTWAAAPTPTVTLRTSAGAGGSVRVELTWPDRSIANTWLQVVLKADATTGLSADDVFYFGSLPGDADGDGIVNFADFVTLSNQFGATGVPIGNASDYDRDGNVSFADFVVLSNNFGRALPTLAAPVPAQPPQQGVAVTVTATARSDSAAIAARRAVFPPVQPASSPFFADAAALDERDAVARLFDKDPIVR